MEIIITCSDENRGSKDIYGKPIQELTRCKNCKYSEPSVYPQAVNCTGLAKAIREWAEGYGCPENKDKICPATDLIMTVFEDHYCGWGERKEDA